MKVPERFRKLLSTTRTDISSPDYAWLVYGVCGLTEDSCCWAGWIIEGVFRSRGLGPPAATGTGDPVLPADYSQVCPNCGRQLFRTDTATRFERSVVQDRPGGLVPGVDYEVKDLD